MIKVMTSSRSKWRRHQDQSVDVIKIKKIMSSRSTRRRHHDQRGDVIMIKVMTSSWSKWWHQSTWSKWWLHHQDYSDGVIVIKVISLSSPKRWRYHDQNENYLLGKSIPVRYIIKDAVFHYHQLASNAIRFFVAWGSCK
jgi:hypothetical protein